VNRHEAKAALQRQNEALQRGCPHDQITSQLMFSGRTEARCHRCMKLIETGPDEALIPALVSSEGDPDTPGQNWQTMGYRLVRLGAVDVQQRMAFMGGGFLAQTAIRRHGAVRTYAGRVASRLEAMQALEQAVQAGRKLDK